MNWAVLPLLLALFGILHGAIGVQAETESLVNETSGSDYRLVENYIVISNLQERLDRLREKLKSKPVDIEAIYRRAENAVDRLEGTGCEDHEVQCGSIERQCVSKLLICDGVKDCVNGLDEDPSYCDVSQIRAGLSFSGWFTEGTCLHGSRRHLYYCKMIVTSVTRNSHFGSLMPMKMTSTCTQKLGADTDSQVPFKMSYSVSGNYQIANRKWFSEAEGYASFCYFPDSSFKMLRCETFIGETVRCNTGIIAYRDE